MKFVKSSRLDSYKLLILLTLIAILIGLISYLSISKLPHYNWSWLLIILAGAAIVGSNVFIVYKVFKAKKENAPWYVIIFSIISAIITYILYGFIKDMSGHYCSGFFGVQQSCVENALLQVAAYGVPLLLMAGGLFTVFAMDGIVKRGSKYTSLRVKKHIKK